MSIVRSAEDVNIVSPVRDHGLDLDAVFADTGCRVVTPAQLREGAGLSDTDREALGRAQGWIEDVIMGVVDKGRKTEAICPMVGPSMEAGVYFLAVGHPEPADDLAAIRHEVHRYGEIFARMAPHEGPIAQVRCLVLVLPETPPERILPAVDPTKSELETELLEAGTMVGEFYEDCPFPATWDRGYFPLQSPIPFYVFRPFIKTDWSLVHTVPAWRAIYKARFGEPVGGDQHQFPSVLFWLAGRVIARVRRFFER